MACGGRAAPPHAVSRTSVVLDGPTIAADSLELAVTDSFGVALAQTLAPGVAPRIVSDRGALDLVDSGGTVFITDRLAVIRYATARPDFAVMPLAWDRQYAIVSAYPINVTDVLDAVRADARAPRERCEGVADAPPRRVVYVASDSIARSLAERYVGTGAAQRAVPLSRDAFDHELATVSDGWYIVTRPAGSDSCRYGALAVLPLIETRSTLIVRRGAVGVVADSSGQPRLELRQ
jgi:hypothetical protein